MRTRSKIGAAWCGLVIAVAACGDGRDRLSASSYARAASAVCTRANRAIARVDIPPLHGDRDASHALTRVVAIQRRSIDGLRELRPPVEFANTVQQWVALLDQATDELELMRIRLRDGRNREAATYGANATTLLARGRELVGTLQVTSCHGPVLPAA